MQKNLSKLIDLKSIVTLAMTAFLGVLLFFGGDVPREVLTLYASSYGAVMTYYFTRHKGENADGSGK